tara:strand:- start:514 stop:807 length:294 start_codon:yes stop_codon:yes gene_type:complete
MKKVATKELHEKRKQVALRGLAAISVKQGFLVSKEEALKTKWFEESYLDDEVWSSSWDIIIRQLKSTNPETAGLNPKAKIAPKAKQAGSGEKNGKSI